MKSFVFLSRAGCLLPFLIIFNLFFGWIFLKPLHWLITEFILVAIFALGGLLMVKKIISFSSNQPLPQPGHRRTGAVDTEAEVIKEE